MTEQEKQGKGAQRALKTLMQRAQQGDAAAYAELLEQVSLMVSVYLSRRVKDKSAVEDIVQDVLLSIHRARHTFRADQPFEPWMFAIAKRRFIDYLRKLMTRRGREVCADDSMLDMREADSELYLGFELRDAFEQLPEKQREAIRLLKFEGLSVKEAALKSGINESALRVSVHRGYKTLKKKLEA